MKSEILTGPNDPVRIEPRWPGTDIPQGQPLPAGSNVSTGVTDTGRWDATQALQFLETAAEAQKQAKNVGVELPADIDFDALVAYVGTGAAVGGIVGASIGFALYAFQWLSDRSPAADATYPNAPQHVRMFATTFAEQAYIEWAVANGTNNWGSEADMVKGQLLYWLERWGVVLVASGSRFYNNIPDSLFIGYAGGEQVVSDLYKQAMVDYNATKAQRIADGTINTSAGYDTTFMFKADVNVRSESGGDGPSPGPSSSGAIVAGAAIIGTIAYISTRNN